MTRIADTDVVNKLFPGFVAFLLSTIATIVTKTFWQLTGLRNYWWFVGLTGVVTYALLFALYLRGACSGLRISEYLIVKGVAILTVWMWLDAAFRVINCGFDRSPPANVEAHVVGRHERKSAHVLKLSGASPLNYVELAVDADMFQRAVFGTPVVVTLHKGALGDGWCGRHAVRVDPPRAAP